MSEIFLCPKCKEQMMQDNFNGMYLCRKADCPKEGCYVSYYDMKGRA